MINKINAIVEAIWFIIAIFALFTGIYRTTQTGFSLNYMWFIITVIAVLMFLYRRYLRKRLNSKK
jgi:glucose uptake protein GlcU